MLANGHWSGDKVQNTPKSELFIAMGALLGNILQSMEILILEYDANTHYPQDGHKLGACSIPLCYSTARLSQQQQGGKPVGLNS